jgi:hypothetical protein
MVMAILQTVKNILLPHRAHPICSRFLDISFSNLPAVRGSQCLYKGLSSF